MRHEKRAALGLHSSLLSVALMFVGPLPLVFCNEQHLRAFQPELVGGGVGAFASQAFLLPATLTLRQPERTCRRRQFLKCREARVLLEHTRLTGTRPSSRGRRTALTLAGVGNEMVSENVTGKSVAPAVTRATAQKSAYKKSAVSVASKTIALSKVASTTSTAAEEVRAASKASAQLNNVEEGREEEGLQKRRRRASKKETWTDDALLEEFALKAVMLLREAGGELESTKFQRRCNSRVFLCVRVYT